MIEIKQQCCLETLSKRSPYTYGECQGCLYMFTGLYRGAFVCQEHYDRYYHENTKDLVKIEPVFEWLVKDAIRRSTVT